MAIEPEILRLVVDQNSPDNAVRQRAELSFAAAARENPSRVAYSLIQAVDTNLAAADVPTDAQQSCLLHLRRLVPQFWSMGFQLFVGPPIDQQLKALIRQSLVRVATAAPLLKIRSGCAYVVAQIAAADYPDEWPSLLDELFAYAVQFLDPVAVTGSLAVLLELLDDLITDEQFWARGVGLQLLGYVSSIVAQPLLAPELKVGALKLYLSVHGFFQSDASNMSDAVLDALAELAMNLVRTLEALLAAHLDSFKVLLVQLQLRALTHKTLALVSEALAKHAHKPTTRTWLDLLLADISYASRAFLSILVEKSNSWTVEPTQDPSDEPEKILLDYTADLYDALMHLNEQMPVFRTVGPTESAQLASNMAKCALFPADVVEAFDDDFNSYVTDATGLSAAYTPRDAIRAFVGELNGADLSRFFGLVHQQPVQGDMNWAAREAALYLVEVAVSDEDSELKTNLPLDGYLTQINGLISADHPLLTARVFLFMPRFIEKFSLGLSGSFAVNEFEAMLDYALSSSAMRELVLASALVSATLWKNIPGIGVSQLGTLAQRKLLDAVVLLLEDSADDTLPVLSEAISVAVAIDRKAALSSTVSGYSVVGLILKVSMSDPANIQLLIDTEECLQTLLEGIGEQDYLAVCQKLVPVLVDVLKQASAPVEYSAELFSALGSLGQIVGAAPAGENLPFDVFMYIFPVLKQVILSTSDDEILQNAGELFSKVMDTGAAHFSAYSDPDTKELGIDSLLVIASKFLSPELSDSAAMNCGLIVMALFDKFGAALTQDFFFQLLQATVQRLAIAKEVITIENLIMVFCKLVLHNAPETLIDALVNIQISKPEGAKNGLEIVMPMWFECFEVTRGFEKIRQNVLALGKIFSLGDDRVSNLVVDGEAIPYAGDVIVTRSMAKTMPQQYTQICAPLKIIKLLVAELDFQCLMPEFKDNQSDVDVDNGDGDGDGEWEDLDDIGPNYDKLKSYVDSDAESGEVNLDEGIRDMLKQFFKECLAKDLGHFRKYYEMLTDDEKLVITEKVLF